MAEITAEVMAGWTTDDTYEVTISEEAGPAQGSLKNPNFPSTVGSSESWTGTIDGCNVGDSGGTFRFRVNSDTTDSFSLPAGSCVTIEISGTGPASFTIYLERST